MCILYIACQSTPPLSIYSTHTYNKTDYYSSIDASNKYACKYQLLLFSLRQVTLQNRCTQRLNMMSPSDDDSDASSASGKTPIPTCKEIIHTFPPIFKCELDKLDNYYKSPSDSLAASPEERAVPTRPQTPMSTSPKVIPLAPSPEYWQDYK